MSIDEIRQQKAMVLLEYQECENRVSTLQHELQVACGAIDRFARILNPGDKVGSPRVADLKQLQAEEFKAALDYDKAVQLATELAQAVADLKASADKKTVLGLR